VHSASKAALELVRRDTATQFGINGFRAAGVSLGVVLTDGAKVGVPDEQIASLVRHNPVPRIGAAEETTNTVVFPSIR
jgi:NAD(P)-dependent dehydrogenase (short-subunit alcohol dehydrogenase family)